MQRHTKNFETIKSELLKLSTIELNVINQGIIQNLHTPESGITWFIELLRTEHHIVIIDICDVMWPMSDVLNTRMLELEQSVYAGMEPSMN